MSFDPKNYPDNWLELVAQVRARSGDSCEICGVPNREYVHRKRLDPTQWRVVDAMHGEALSLESEWVTWIVLTTHHACDCDKRTCVDISHFQHLCQRCHLNLDRDHHLAVQAANREAKRLKVQPRLIEVAP